MYTFLYKFFHNETNDRAEKGLVHVPKDKKDWPDSWKKVEYKRYSLFKALVLPWSESLFFKQLSLRRSATAYVLNNKLTFPILAYILQCGYGLQRCQELERRENRTVPSGGKRYPLEVYVFIFRDIDGCKAGIYHYGVKDHVLEPVRLMSFSAEIIQTFVPEQEWAWEMNGIICLTSVFERMTDKYGSRGYRFILFEAGHVAQNMLLAATEHSVNIIPMGGVEECVIERLLGLSSPNERLVYTLFL